MKRIVCTFCALLWAILTLTPAAAVELSLSAPSAILMEKETGQILYTQNEHEKLEPASVTKVMTLLLVMEAIDSGTLSWEDNVTASARACSMGGSQIWLKENEQMSVRDMVKAICVVSANDCSVALAEHVAGSEENFVAKMNNRAAELGMADTSFLNTTGLPAKGHLTSAHDIALMSRELVKNHPALREFTTLWMDTLRDGTSELVNTNKLIRFYDGATGLKTGSTDSAGYCLSATAERQGMELIAVVVKAPTSAQRFEDAKALLNFGFAGYSLTSIVPDTALPPMDVILGSQPSVQPVLEGGRALLLPKEQAAGLEKQMTLLENVEAPVEQGQKLGQLTVSSGGEMVAVLPIVAGDAVPRLSWGQMMLRVMQLAFLAG